MGNLKLCRADFVYVIQEPSREHYNCCIFIAQMLAVTPLLLKSNEQNRPDRTLDLPFFFRYKHMTSLKSLFPPAPSKSLPYLFQGNFAAIFVLNYWLREFPLSAFANHFESRCEPKQLMLFFYKMPLLKSTLFC